MSLQHLGTFGVRLPDVRRRESCAEHSSVEHVPRARAPLLTDTPQFIMLTQLRSSAVASGLEILIPDAHRYFRPVYYAPRFAPGTLREVEAQPRSRLHLGTAEPRNKPTCAPPGRRPVSLVYYYRSTRG